ncbi:MAG TPA: FadR/GntR family transcriptional regulator [Anaerolineae bacterium]
MDHGSLRGPALTRAIQERIKDYINANRLRPGDPLPPEGQLAADLGISRGSVREAIKALESLGIVQVRHGSGVFVRGFNLDSILTLFSYGMAFDPDTIPEILQIRVWLETAPVDEVLARLDDGLLHRLEALMAAWGAKVEQGEATGDEDREFHRLLYSALGNQSFTSLLEVLWVAYHATGIVQATGKADQARTYAEHQAILAAVAAKDAGLVRARIIEHYPSFEELSALVEARRVRNHQEPIQSI